VERRREQHPAHRRPIGGAGQPALCVCPRPAPQATLSWGANPGLTLALVSSENLLHPSQRSVVNPACLVPGGVTPHRPQRSWRQLAAAFTRIKPQTVGAAAVPALTCQRFGSPEPQNAELGEPTELICIRPRRDVRIERAANSRQAADPQRSVPRNRSLSVIGHGALLVAASGILVAAHAGRRARTGARSNSRGERDAHGALPKRLHAVRPVDRHIARSLTAGGKGPAGWLAVARRGAAPGAGG